MLFVTKPDIFCIPCKLRVCKFPKNSMYRCHPYHFMEICKPPVNEPIRSYQIPHLKGTQPAYMKPGQKVLGLDRTTPESLSIIIQATF